MERGGARFARLDERGRLHYWTHLSPEQQLT